MMDTNSLGDLDGLGLRRRYAPTGGGNLLIEGFESTPFASSLTWDHFDDGTLGTETRTTSNVTQGTYSWRLFAVQASNTDDVFTEINTETGGGAIDLTGYSTVELDVTIADLGAGGGSLTLSVFDGSSSVEDDLATETTATLSVNINTLDKTNIFFYITGKGTGSGAPGATIDVYIDNLRAS